MIWLQLKYVVCILQYYQVKILGRIKVQKAGKTNNKCSSLLMDSQKCCTFSLTSAPQCKKKLYTGLNWCGEMGELAANDYEAQ